MKGRFRMSIMLDRRDFLRAVGLGVALAVPGCTNAAKALKAERRRLPNIALIMADDPYEETDLWARHPEIVEDLTKLLEKYKKEGHSRPL